jgi:lipopolysaccharide transport system ATP-binding protein
MPTVISVENLSKTYYLGQIGTGTFANDMKLWWAKVRGKPNPLLKIGEADHGNRDGEELMALRDVSFTVQKGEILGIIGKNGAGKSTLLKILSRVTAPTSGAIKVKGRIASLLEVGTGFHPELTGRENTYLNGAILGMSRQEVARKFDEIVNFAEVEKFIDTPVKRYSSGMYVRLAFAVAAHLEPEILIVDEVLAVGDAEFQKKCLGKMGDVAREGRTVLFVSHNMVAIKSLCPKCIWLNEGEIQKMGNSAEIVQAYLQISTAELVMHYQPQQPFAGQNIDLLEARLLFEGDQPQNGQELIFNATIRVRKVMRFSVNLYVYREDSLSMVVSDHHAPIVQHDLSPGLFIVRFTIPPYLLNPGLHSLGIAMVDENGNGIQFLNAQHIIRFDLMEDGYRRGNRYYRGWGGAVSPILPVSLFEVNE